MSAIHKQFVAAILRSLRRGKSLLQAIVDFFKLQRRSSSSPMAQTSKKAKSNMLSVPVSPCLNESSSSSTAVADILDRDIKDYLAEVENELLGRTSDEHLIKMAEGFKVFFLNALQTGEINMLPSYSYRLPSGQESGRYLVADMGGSNLRVALIELRGAKSGDDKPAAEIVNMKNFRVTEDIRNFAGIDFFGWMADRIRETLLEADMIPASEKQTEALPLSLAWSFPIDQTSVGDGKLLDMGKGLRAVEGLKGQFIGDVIRKTCASRGIKIELKAILNDSTACLLSQAYTYLSTRMGLILGTGTNIAAFLPVAAVGQHKYGTRHQSWWDAAAQVVVNTEVSMVGKDVLPMTRWDAQLKSAHERPDFQPLEQMASGMYLGEICRLIIIEAIETTGLLGGEIPPSLMMGYSLATETLARIESDTSASLASSVELWHQTHPNSQPPSISDIQAIRSITSFVARRSAALIAAAVYSLWDLRTTLSTQYAPSFAAGDVRRSELETEGSLNETTVAFNGSVIEKYPGYLNNCSEVLDRLVEQKVAGIRVKLVMAQESSLFGAAIALACEER